MVILLVDGDADARTQKAALLEEQGHEVMQASTAVEAVHFAQNAEKVDLLITEVILDAQTFGFDLSEAILVRLPEMRTLYTTRFDLTGYEDELAGRKPVPATASTAAFLAAVKKAEGQPPAPVVVSAMSEEPIMPPGTLLGHYQIIDRLYSEAEAETYRAIQYTVQRPVALVLMKPHLLGNAKAVAGFKDRERVKASISHPRIAPLYEAGEANGWLFYTREMPPGKSLQDMAAAGEHLSERVLVDVLYRVSEAMAYAVERGYNYRTIAARDMYVDGENQASMVNIFRPAAAMPRDQPADVRALLELLGTYVTNSKARSLLHDLSLTSHDWTSLATAIHDIRDDLSERSLIKRAKVEDIAVAPPPSRSWMFAGAAVGVLALVAYLGVLSGGTGQGDAKVVSEEMIQIPKGEFVYQQGRYNLTPDKDFWISKYEVTVAQYAEFLEALKKSGQAAFDDPLQPRSKTTHEPSDWAAYYAAASTQALFNNQPVSLISPVSGVDYWDAVAYAKWRGHRLPKEHEWEKAARGLNGNVYPWGNEAKPGAANLGDDYAPQGRGGQIDGYNLWSPVDQPPGDVSAFGVVGMAGNVQEWTATWSPHPDLPDKRVPVLRGGHFGMPSSNELLTARHFADDADESTIARGFRTVSDSPPATGAR